MSIEYLSLYIDKIGYFTKLFVNKIRCNSNELECLSLNDKCLLYSRYCRIKCEKQKHCFSYYDKFIKYYEKQNNYLTAVLNQNFSQIQNELTLKEKIYFFFEILPLMFKLFHTKIVEESIDSPIIESLFKTEEFSQISIDLLENVISDVFESYLKENILQEKKELNLNSELKAHILKKDFVYEFQKLSININNKLFQRISSNCIDVNPIILNYYSDVSLNIFLKLESIEFLLLNNPVNYKEKINSLNTTYLAPQKMIEKKISRRKRKNSVFQNNYNKSNNLLYNNISKKNNGSVENLFDPSKNIKSVKKQSIQQRQFIGLKKMLNLNRLTIF